MTPPKMDTQNDTHDALDERLDTLLATRVPIRQNFSETVLRTLENDTATLDKIIDRHLRHQPVKPDSERIERIFRHVTGAILRRKIIAWATPAFAAALTGLIALPAFVGQEKPLDAEQLISQAMQRDPALAAMLDENDTDAPLVFEINENAVEWLEILFATK